MKYRKIPVVIEAMELIDNHETKIALELWLDADPKDYHFNCWLTNPTRIEILTLEGTMTADVGDFIIKGVKGEFYPCKPDIFALTYELAEEAEYPQRWVGGHDTVISGG